ncbi:protein of unknown function [Candidatus Methylomirabilis oxygeniifera]|uniref:Uncharacterized protein n=1 Tax=Methylomirabilis oxygeniifera TaxID=671143 RepID=D5MMD3_METO1|nr:protein of unknown function [Candidatus Methylomirabilis oxyfera]
MKSVLYGLRHEAFEWGQSCLTEVNALVITGLGWRKVNKKSYLNVSCDSRRPEST